MAAVNISGNLNDLRRHLNRSNYRGAANLMNVLSQRPHFAQEVRRVPELYNYLVNLHPKLRTTRNTGILHSSFFPGSQARRVAAFQQRYVNALARAMAEARADRTAGPNVNMGNAEANERRARVARAQAQANANRRAGQRIAEQAARNAAVAEAARLRRAAEEANARARANAVNANRRRAAAERAARNTAAREAAERAARNAAERARRNAAAAQAARNAASAANAAARAHKAQTNAAAANAARRAKAHANAAAAAAAGGAGGSAGTNAAKAAKKAAKNAANAAARAEAEENARKAENEKLSKATNNLSGSSRATLTHNKVLQMKRNLLAVRKHLLSSTRQTNYNRHLANLNQLLAENAASGSTKSANQKQSTLASLRYRLGTNGTTSAVKLMAKRYQKQYGNLPANLRHLL